MMNDPHDPPTQNSAIGRNEGYPNTTSGPGRPQKAGGHTEELESIRHSLGEDAYSNPTTEESVELDDMVSESGLSDDEETGLTSKERHERRRRKKIRTALDARVAEDVDIRVTKDEKKMADISVVKRSLINVLLICSWYFFSLTISLYNKWMFSPDHLDFHFPLFTTSLHMLVQFCLASLLLYLFPRFRPVPAPSTSTSPPKPLITRLFYLTRLVPCGTATSLDIGLGNMSLKFITLTFYTMCKSSALAFVLLFAFVFRLETPSWKLIFIIATMTAGVIMMVAGETAFNALGFALIISSAFFSGFRWSLTQILLLRHPATSNPFATLFFITPIMFSSLMLIALPIEGPSKIISGIGVLADKKGGFVGFLLLLFPGILAFCMTSTEFALLQRTSVVTLSICGIFKEVVTISAAGIVFHDQLTPINVSGLVVTIASIAAYNYLKISKMRQEAMKDIVEHDALAAEAGGHPGRSSVANDSLASLLGDDPEEERRIPGVPVPRLMTDVAAARRDESPGSLRSSNGSGSTNGNRNVSPMKRVRDLE